MIEITKSGRFIISQKGLGLIKKYEGLKLESYKCPAGVWTIGYGHTATAVEGMSITESQAGRLLIDDTQGFVDTVNDAVNVPITGHMFDAMVVFAYNVGSAAFRRSTLLRELNNYNYGRAAQEFPKWNKAGGKVLKGLVKRRAEEQSLFALGVEDLLLWGGSLLGTD